MIVTRKSLSRRSILKGLGAAIALPVLDAMTPAFAAASRLADGAAPRRMAFMYVPNGIIMDQYTPATAGADFQLTRVLEPLAAYREDFMVLSGLTLNGGRALGDGAGDHARAASSFLTSAHPVKTAGADIKVGVSVDQMAAQAVGDATKFPSLELTCEDGRLVGSCDSGYSCAYSNSISWRTPSTPNPAEINPRAVFERLFGDAELDPVTRAKRSLYNKSILDFVSDDTRRLQGTLGSTDRRKLDEYLFAVREIEQRIEKAEKDSATLPMPSMERPAGVPVDFAEHARLMFDLMVAAFQTDQTRIATFMIGREGSGRVYRETRYLGRSPSVDTSPQQSRDDRERGKDQQVSHGAIRLFPREAEEHQGRRRHTARSFDGSVRQRLERRQPASTRSSSRRPGRTRRRQHQTWTPRHLSRGNPHGRSVCGHARSHEREARIVWRFKGRTRPARPYLTPTSACPFIPFGRRSARGQSCRLSTCAQPLASTSCGSRF